MKYVLFILSFIICFNIEAQNRISINRGLQKCFEIDGITPKPNCFIITDVNGAQVYVDSSFVLSALMDTADMLDHYVKRTENITGSAASLTTGRTISITGDLTYTSGSFDGTGNVTGSGTLATVASAGTTGSSTAIPVVTINAKGLTTGITTAAVVAPAGTLSGATLASGVTASSLTSVGTLTSLAVNNGSALTDGAKALSITATLPTVSTVANTAVDVQVTSAGSSAQIQRAFNFDLLAGYTGSSSTQCFRTSSNVAGTGTTVIVAACNQGGFAAATGTTTGTNVGMYGSAQNGNISVGVFGRSVLAKNSATNIGVYGSGINTGTTPIQIGGYFGLHAADPTFASAALMCDNGSTTSDIFVARDNGTAKVTIADGGATTIQVLATNTSTSTSLTITSAQYGSTLFWSPGGTATATLPANGAAAGSWFDVIVLTDQTTTISAATADTLIIDGDTQADSVSFSTASHKIGSSIRFISNGSVWIGINLGSTTMTITS